jgi:hypothetical protein
MSSDIVVAIDGAAVSTCHISLHRCQIPAPGVKSRHRARSAIFSFGDGYCSFCAMYF